MSAVNVAGADVDLTIPDDAVVAGAIIVATYQRMDGDGVAAGTIWGHSSIPHVQAVGMMRLATIAIENQADYS